MGLVGSVAHIHNGQSYPGLLWDLLAALLISITVCLIHSLLDCIPEVYCGRPSLDSRTALSLAGNVARILMDCIPEVYCGRLSLDSRTAVGFAGTVARIHNGQSYPLPNGLYT